MKKHMLKSIFAALLVASMAFSLTACGGDDKTPADPGTSDVADGGAAEALSEDDYIAAVNNLQTEMEAVQTKMAEVDQTDVEAVKAAIEDVKKPFADLAAVVAPEKYAAAHEKIKSGCEAMIDYMDSAIKMTEGTPSQDDITAMTESLTKAATDLGEGQALIEEAK